MTEIQKISRRYALGKIPLDNSRVIELVKLGLSRHKDLESDVDLSDDNIESIESHYKGGDYSKNKIIPHIFIKLKVGVPLAIDMFEYVIFNHPLTLGQAQEVKKMLDQIMIVQNMLNKTYSNMITNNPTISLNLKDSLLPYVELLKGNNKIPDDVKLFLQLGGWL
jgi:hypothetical protein